VKVRQKANKEPPLFSFFVIGIIVVCLHFSSCGIEEYVYLYPPENLIFTDSKTLQLSNNINNGAVSAFLGYKILYKFYKYPVSESSSAYSERATVEGYSSRDARFVFDYMTKTLKYREIIINSQESFTIPNAGDRSQSFTLEISFSDPSSGVKIYFAAGSPSTAVVFNPAITTDPGTSASLFRYSGSPLDFSETKMTVNTSEDLSEAQTEAGKTYLQLAVVGYGVSSDLSGVLDVYSLPKWFNGGIDNVIELPVEN